MYKMCKQLLWVSLAINVMGCSVDDSTLPTERPTGVITGRVIDGALTSAQVSIYRYDQGIRGRHLGETVTDNTGAYRLDIQSPSQVVLLEAKGGSYIEQATGTTITLSSDQHLTSIAYYQSGEFSEVMITPLTHLGAALVEYKLKNGATIDVALAQALSTVDNFFNIATHTAIPIDVTAENNTVTALSDEVLYGFYLAGISNWTWWAGIKNLVNPHTVYTSIGLIQILYNDVVSDGVLDGNGYNKDGTELMPLAFGTVALNTDMYRTMFSLHMLAVASFNSNTTQLKPIDLESSAQSLATKSSDLLGLAPAIDISSQEPTLTLKQSLDEVYSGLFSFQVDIGGALGAIYIDLFVNDQLIGVLNAPLNPVVVIDTRDYPDGDYHIKLVAYDTLLNSASLDFPIQFDNTAPVINVTSPGVSHLSTMQLVGTYADNIAGIQAIMVGEESATLLEDGTWHTMVQLTEGENIIEILTIDTLGNTLTTQTTVYYDDIAPLIDLTLGHGTARYSNGDGSYIEDTLQSENSTALFLETNRIDLAGVTLTRAQLESNLIPYFAFTISDKRSPDSDALANELTVRIQYEQNSEILNPWRTLPQPSACEAAPTLSCEYLIPLVSEILASDWHQAIPTVEHMIRAAVTDTAGNQSLIDFNFYADFYVPNFTATEPAIEDLDPFTDTPFAGRDLLNNTQLSTTRYTFTNPSNHAVFLTLRDDSSHWVEQWVDQEIRQHQITKSTTIEWQVGLITAMDTQGCLVFTDIPSNWTPAPAILNWNTDHWETRLPNENPIADTEESVLTDDLTSLPETSAWSDVPHFNDGFESVVSDTLSFDQDYKLTLVGAPAFITNATANGNPCAEQRYFQQRQRYSYVSLAGYPRDELSKVLLSGGPEFEFETTQFIVVINGDDQNPLSANGEGWYAIPGGSEVTLTKQVTTPNLMRYEEDFDTDASYTTAKRRDASITWIINRNLTLSLSHNAGETNIPDMPVNQTITGSSNSSHEIAR